MMKRSKLSPAELAVAIRLREVRVEEQFSLAELAAECGFTKAVAINYEYGKTAVPFEVGNAICRRLDINQRWLATGEHPRRPFIDPSDLADDPAVFRALEKVMFYEAYSCRLKAPLDRWHAANPLEKLVAENIASGAEPIWRRMSRASLEAMAAQYVSWMRKSDDESVKAAILQNLRRLLAQLETRYKPKNSVDATPTEWDLSSMQISGQIKKARARLGLTQEQAAKSWGVSVKTIQSWEQGTRTPRGLGMRQLETILRTAGSPNG